MSTRGRGSRGYSRGGGGYGGYRGGGGGYRGGRGGDRGGRGGGGHNYGGDRYGGQDKYSRNDRSDEIGFKKSYRSDGPSGYGGGREHMSRGGSPDRKRMRMDGSGGRRSNDYSEYGGRHDSYSSERRNYVERRSPAREYAGGYRKDMAPPRSPRRSWRARPPRSSRGGSYRGQRPRRLVTRHSDYTARRLKQVKLRSSLAAKQDYVSSSEPEEEENWDEEEEKKSVKEETGEAVVSKSPAKVVPEGGSEAVGGDATDKEAREGSGEEAEAEGEGEAEPELDEEKLPHTAQRSYIRLMCAHCREKSLTFKTYSRHLMSRKHQNVMDDVALKLKVMLQRMRTSQRKQQRSLEEVPDDTLGDQMFCPLCKLIYRSSRQAHFRSEAHKNMKKFLLPNCRVCSLSFRTPMMYEHHICSLEHIRKKAQLDKKPVKASAEAGSGEEGMDVDLENFMTLDSVGDVDEVDEDSAGEKKNEDDTDTKSKPEINIGSEHVKKIEVYYCELCKMYLPRGGGEVALRRHCRMRTHLTKYVRFRDNRTLRKQAERIHRIHQQAKEEKKEVSTVPGEDVEVKKEIVENAEGEGKENGVSAGGTVAAPAAGEGEWADVDQELGDLLRDVEQQHKSSDDEDDSNTGRYDRFRKSDKKPDLGEAKGESALETAKKEVAVPNGGAADVVVKP